MENYRKIYEKICKIKIPKNYEKYLSHMYGDYNIIPSVDKKERHILLAFDLKKW